ncbi:GNAT family N-acetyltransferase [Deinococcus aestuarii]|uniref:GNAT family N-acetyltransferase n=1 Tax=Deinococcus aestuarii TaxID=2774531 RepID=UPI001C0E3072|nr:GNAT family N-acetyltransferase [Deinococcus aestuarii]
MPDLPRLRPATPTDQAAVGRVAYLTGFFGESAERYFPDPALFADLWVRPYLEETGPASLVAEVGGQVVGYVLGASAPNVYRRALRTVVLRRVLPRWLGGRYTRPLAAGPYLLRALRFPSPHAPWDVYPAHLHLNLLPAARGSGLGRRLLEAHLRALEAAGVPGVQLSTTRENAAALILYHKCGFEEVAARVTPLWTPWLGRPVEHLALARHL